MSHIRVYRSIIRELSKSSVNRPKIDNALKAHYRTMVVQAVESGKTSILDDLTIAVDFLHAQREHAILMDRYNPMVDFSSEDRVKATARRVGLDMPITHDESKAQ